MATLFENILDELDEMAEEAFNVPLSGGKCVVNGELLRTKLEELRVNLPMEMKKASEICAERDKIIERSKKEYDAKLAAAESKAQYLLDNDRITKEAKKRADELIKAAEDEAARLRAAACKFVDDNMSEAEGRLDESLKSVRQVRAKIAKMNEKK